MEGVGTVGSELVSIMERASAAVETRPPFVRALLLGLLGGLVSGALILFILDRLDDRMNSQSEFEGRFPERVIGQIPQIDPTTATTILQVNDDRHSFAEAFRNVRSSIHFMPFDNERPRSFVVTSATPSEGKTTTSSNLAVTMAYAGATTLLVDADLRRGTVHEQFRAQSTPGLTEVLEGRYSWPELALKTTIPNLHILTRGRTINEAGQLFMSSIFDDLLADLLKHYDIILFDTPPVLAADDTTSLAPKADATIFVVRLSQTLARQSRKALDLLYERQANVIGVILNCADPSMPEYKYYYQYSQYYYHAEEGAEKTRKRKSPAAA
jgi:capsular exopolysaccharide synthesis family protein